MIEWELEDHDSPLSKLSLRMSSCSLCGGILECTAAPILIAVSRFHLRQDTRDRLEN